MPHILNEATNMTAYGASGSWSILALVVWLVANDKWELSWERTCELRVEVANIVNNKMIAELTVISNTELVRDRRECLTRKASGLVAKWW